MKVNCMIIVSVIRYDGSSIASAIHRQRTLTFHKTSWLGPKKQDLWPKINISKRKSLYCTSKKCQNLTFKVNFLCPKSSKTHFIGLLFNLPSQNGIWVEFYHFWPKNDGQKQSRKNISEIPACASTFLLIHFTS